VWISTDNKLAKFHGNILSLSKNIAKSFRGATFFDSHGRLYWGRVFFGSNDLTNSVKALKEYSSCCNIPLLRSVIDDDSDIMCNTSSVTRKCLSAISDILMCMCVCRDAEFCTEGVQHFVSLVEKYYFVPAVHCLFYVTPLFYTTPSYLTASVQ